MMNPLAHIMMELRMALIANAKWYDMPVTTDAVARPFSRFLVLSVRCSKER
ncbi:hypothetical protein [Rhizobium halophilum]|uniref:hypothetical protein n=1 Tax=Rhizobium halophilum TaxID=2846852 RepID=UPI001EFEE619|nr:hypothetical protein [Rhizobium halophilum]MCF6368109.1 hypothetical protein [Rhizobium halophilum]